jgi:dATP pyrophosphohydrolase
MIPILSDGIAVYVFRRKSSDFEFLQLRRSDGDTYAQSWQPIYGGVQPEEKAEEAARRELFEETGIRSELMFLVEYLESFFFRPKNAIYMFPVFAAEFGSEHEVILNEEHDEYRWVSSTEVNEKFMWRSQREAISVLLDTLINYKQNISALLV